MSRRSLAKRHDEFLWEWMDSYWKKHGGAYRMEDLARWILDHGLLPPPHISPTRLLTQKLKQAARRRRFRDAQGRSVRRMIAAKIDRVDSSGNQIIDVVWDYLHDMSLDHALKSFSQRDDIIQKQRLAATRDVESVLDNNPNIAGHEDQFRFGFMLEEPRETVKETLGETDWPHLPSSGESADYDTHPLSRKKPR